MSTAHKTPMADPTKATLRDSAGKPVILTSMVARGGQGAVYRVAQRPDVVCKIFDHYENAIETEPKIRAMIAAPPEDPTRANGHVSIAWPTTLVHDSAGRFVGFLMPLVVDSYPIEQYFRHSSRQTIPFKPGLVDVYRVVRNVAAIFAQVHQRGYIVGDINPRNLLVKKGSICAIIDCDSMQVPTANGKVYLCSVFVPEMTDPELYNVDLKKVPRTIDSELYNLAILLFRLLMEGFHPFQGILKNPTPLPNVQLKNMRDGIFPYQTNPHCNIAMASPTFDCLSPTIQALFTRAFTQKTNRPTATEWHNAFIINEDRLYTCTNDPQHAYPVDGNCVRCSVLKRVGQFTAPAKPGEFKKIHNDKLPPKPKTPTPAPPQRKTIIGGTANGFASAVLYADGTATVWGGEKLNQHAATLLNDALELRYNSIISQADRCKQLLTSIGNGTFTTDLFLQSHLVIRTGKTKTNDTLTYLDWLRQVELSLLRQTKNQLAVSVPSSMRTFSGIRSLHLSNSGAYLHNKLQQLTYVPFIWSDTNTPTDVAPATLRDIHRFSVHGDVGIAIDKHNSMIRFGRSKTSRHEISGALAKELNEMVVQLHAREILGRVTTIARRSDLHAFEWIFDIDDPSSEETQRFHTFTDFKETALSAYCLLVLKRDGAVKMWGRGIDTDLFILPTDALKDVTEIAAGIAHYVALKTDGTVVVWGDDTYGQCAVPRSLKDVAFIRCGDYHTIAVTKNNVVYAWGDNRRGQCDVPASLRA